MNTVAPIKIVFSPVFRTLSHYHEHDMIMERENRTVVDLLQQLSEETSGKMDTLIFEKDTGLILAGLMVKINERLYTGTMLNQNPVPLNDGDVVSLLYYVSGG